MFKLNEISENSIGFEGKTYHLNLSFDTVLDVFEILENGSLTNFDKIDVALAYLVEEKVEGKLKPPLYQLIFKTHIQQAKEKVVYDLAGNVMPQKPKQEEEELFSFVHDAEFIYASFWQAYHMDLHEQIGKLSWKKFQILFSNLPEDTKFKEVVQIRKWKPKPKMSAEEKRKMLELQELYALPDREEAGNE